MKFRKIMSIFLCICIVFSFANTVLAYGGRTYAENWQVSATKAFGIIPNAQVDRSHVVEQAENNGMNNSDLGFAGETEDWLSSGERKASFWMDGDGNTTNNDIKEASSTSIQEKFRQVQEKYPPNQGVKFTGSYGGCTECFGFARIVFYNLFGCDMPAAYYNARRYEYVNTNNVILIGQLEGVAEVSTQNVKALLSQARMGDIIQACGSYHHTMVVVEADDSGVVLYDANSLGDDVIRQTRKSYEEMAQIYGRVHTSSQTGMSLYRAANYDSLYGDFVAIDASNFPDATFRSYIAENFDTNGDNRLSAAEREAVTEIHVSNSLESAGMISSLEGIANFPALNTLYCGNNQLTSLDLSENTALTYLDCSWNSLVTLDVSRCIELSNLNCWHNQLSYLDLTQNTNLIYLDCAWNKLTNLDISGCSALTELNCSMNQLTTLDINGCSSLTGLNCFSNQLVALDVSKNTGIIYLDCSNNALTSLDVRNNTSLQILICSDNQLTNLDLSNNTKLSDGWLYTTEIGSSTYSIVVDAEKTVDLSDLPGSFDCSKVSNLIGGKLRGDILSVASGATEVTYTYDTGSDWPLSVTLLIKVREPANEMSIYRLYNPGNGKHHYTTDTSERDFLVANGWIYEGVAWYAPEAGEPIYRVYNPGNDNHLYTMDVAERDRLVDGGWIYEGILCYSAGSDGVPLYRVFNPYVTLNPHHYTDSLEECAFLESNGWRIEGISWYGLSK